MGDITTWLLTAVADRYRIEREIGSGGMATVYLARDLKHDRAVAVKVLRPELSAVLGGNRFVNEIRISARLDHLRQERCLHDPELRQHTASMTVERSVRRCERG